MPTLDEPAIPMDFDDKGMISILPYRVPSPLGLAQSRSVSFAAADTLVVARHLTQERLF